MKEEKKFETKIKAFLSEQGAWFVKTWSNGVQKEGIPDILACVGEHFVGIEVKAEKGHPSDLQLWNIRNIRRAGGIGIILYPDHWEMFKEMIKTICASDFDPYYADVSWWEEQTRFDEKLNRRERRLLYGA